MTNPRILAIAGAAVGIIVLAIAGSLLPGAPAAESTTQPPATVDQRVLDLWWKDGSVPASVMAITDSVRWDGVALVAQTRIVANASAATSAAKAVCMALSAYGLTHGGFLPVQVVGADGGVLVSRRSEGDVCTWRA